MAENTQDTPAKKKRKQQQVEEKQTEDGKKKKARRTHTALPWMRVPAAFPPSSPVSVMDVSGMRGQLAAALRATGHRNLFPVQAVAWEVLAGGMSSKHDLCIDAPTGSGKTLAYALPVLQRCLEKPAKAGIQALVVVPTRVLAKQVFDVFQTLQAHLPPLRIVLANGSSSIASELSQLSGSRSDGNLPRSHCEDPAHASSHPYSQRELHTEPTELDVDDMHDTTDGDSGVDVDDCSAASSRGQQDPTAAFLLPDLLPSDRKCFGHPHRGCRSVSDLLKSVAAQRMEEDGSVDAAAFSMHGQSVWRWGHLKPQLVSVAVVTPGRLVHHIQELGHQWLANLEFMVVDEADRLLRQAYNEWLPVLNEALERNKHDARAVQGGGGGGAAGQLRGQYAALARCAPCMKREVRVLVSATLTKDPTKLAKMSLQAPRFIAVDTPPPAAPAHPHSQTEGSVQEASIKPPSDQTPDATTEGGPAAEEVRQSNRSKKSKKAAKLTGAHTGTDAHNEAAAEHASHQPAAYTQQATEAPEALGTKDRELGQAAVPSAYSTQLTTSGVQSTMHEYQVVTAAHTKPHALIALLAELSAAQSKGEVRVVVFASAVDAARRLKNLLVGSGDVLGMRVYEMSSRVASRVQVETLAALSVEPSWVLVASDNMTRGMDLSRVHTVINYDLPAHIRTYVHRAGRTARAGTTGSVYTILRSEHLGAFSSMIRRGGRKGVPTHKIDAGVWNNVKNAVAAALEYVQQQEEV